MILVLNYDELDDNNIPYDYDIRLALLKSDKVIVTKIYTFDIIKDRFSGVRTNSIPIEELYKHLY